MGRRFQSGHSVIFPVPAALNGTDAGPRTILAVGKATSAYQCIVWTTPTGATPGWWAEIDTAGTLHVNYGTGNSSLRNVGTIGSGADEIWTARKDNGGSVNPFGRKFTGASFATDGGDVDPGATLVDGLAIDTTYGIQVGVWGKLSGSPFFSTDLTLYFLAFWNTLQSGATLAGLTKTKAGITGAASPPDYWISFEGTTATDSVGGTPTIVGTTTTADPSGFFGSGSLSGDLALSSSATLTAGATRQQFGAAALSSGSTLTAAGTRQQFGALAMTSGSNLTAAGTRVQPATVALSSGSNLTVAATPVRLGTAALAAAPALTVTAVLTKLGLVALSSAPTLTAAAQGTQTGTLALSSSPTLAAAGIIPAPAVDYVTAVLTASVAAPAILTPGASAGAILTAGAAAPATLIASTL